MNFTQFCSKILIKLRILKFKCLSDSGIVLGKPELFQPLLVRGKGKIHFGNQVQIGVLGSPLFYSHYAYIEARNPKTKIIIGDSVSISNGFSIEALEEVIIEEKVLIGTRCSIIDNDGHALAASERLLGTPKSAPIRIEENVFLGDNVTILKGVTIGKNSVIGNGSVVTKSVPENVIAAGNPAKVIRSL